MNKQAKIIIIGGGVVGCSTAYHLALMGCKDVILLEMNELTSGSTWHAAGNVPTYSGSRNIMKLQHYSVKLYAELARDKDFPINYHNTGSLRLARNPERLEEFRHSVAVANAMGMEYQLFSDEQTQSIYPFLNLDDVYGVLWDPYDGDIDPSQLTQAFARKARQAGVSIERFSPVRAINQLNGGAWQISCDEGRYTGEIVVNAAGYRGAEIAAMVGQFLPIVSMQHQYLVTESIKELSEREEKIPLLRDPDDSYYLRQERDGLILGPYEWKATPHWQDGRLPEDFSFQLYPDDLDRLEWYIESACKRVPILGQVGVQKVINGPIPYSPDGNPYIGPAFGLNNFYHCCSFSFGICQAGGAGKTIAEWILDGKPEWDFWTLDPRRYTGYATQKYVVEKARELYQHEYAIPFPYEERDAGRPAKMTPVYPRLQAKGAQFGARGGWERATWFPRKGDDCEQKLSFKRQRPWSDAVAEECKAVQERVGILDLGGFTKFELSGDGAAQWLDSMIAGNLPRVGRISLSYFCLPSGGVWSEMTLTRLAKDRFWLISAAAAEWHDEQWLRQHLPDDESVRLSNITEQSGTLILAGPRSRELLSELTAADLSNKAFPWLSCRHIDLGFCTALALRVNYVGELGWELHLPTSSMLAAYDALWEAGQNYGISDFGMYAMESLRVEKCYRAWKVELDCEYSPLRSGLDRFVNLEKKDFLGKKAIEAEYEQGLPDVFAAFVLDEGKYDAVYGCPVTLNGENVGYTTSGAFGYRLQKSIALGYIRNDLAIPGTEVTVRVFGEDRKGVVTQEPVYDPENARLLDK